ncbi:tetratricopeptide repeat protein [Bacillus dakarensis]|uniref:tetratricopeptide repeat protein n=1 Tax=Robertmurraya dakarensis TaxID=1926278 RepID=UPI00098172C8|nr:tetratricopeptide repeat protein [Bacillus dakarensis]
MEEKSLSMETIEYYFQIQRYEHTIKLIKEAMNEQIENGRLWYMLGFSHYQLNDYDVAEEQLIESMRLGMNRAVVFPILGHLYLETERFQKAEEAFLETLRLNPTDVRTHASYAFLMAKAGQRKKAKALIYKALELDPEDAHVLRYYLRLEGLTSKGKQQMTALEQYMNSSDSELAKLIQLGVLASLQDRVAEAKEHFRQAFLLNPEDKKLLAILEEMDIQNHPLSAPNRLIMKFGGPLVFWVIGLGVMFLLQAVGFPTLAAIWLLVYMLFVIYTWISLPIVRLIRKIRR